MARFTQGGSSNFGGAELNYVQVVGTQQVISSAPNAIVDLNITTTGKAVQISVTGEGSNASAGSWLRLNLFRDNVEIGNAIQLESSAASENVPFAINFIDDVPAGTYNYSARVTTINGGSWTFGEAAGPVINAVELTGFKGDRGPRGFKGDQGEPGVPGADGAQGIAGQDGADGLSAYQIAVANGFVGTEQEWLDSLGGSGVDAHGLFVFDNSTLSVDNETVYFKATDGGDDSVQLLMDPYNGIARLSANGGMQTPRYYPEGGWESATWTTLGEDSAQVSFVNAPNIVDLMNNTLTNASNVGVFVNGTNVGAWNGASTDGNNVTIYFYGPNAENTQDASVTEFGFNYVFESKIEIDNDENELNLIGRGLHVNITATGNRDIEITAGDQVDINALNDDLFLRANDDVVFVANYQAGGTEHTWSMDSEGKLQLPGQGYIENPLDSSGDGNGYDTIKIVPDAEREEFDQYLIIDPTQPNHIHIRGGGTQDASQADLILGAEKTNVQISDQSGNVTVSAKGQQSGYFAFNVNMTSNDQLVYQYENPNDIPVNATVEVNGINRTVSSVSVDAPVEGMATVIVPGAEFLPNTEYYFTWFDPEKTWTFFNSGEGNLVLPHGNPSIVNPAAPGSITISAYSGVNLGFAEGGLKFPDETVQTTAYIPGADNFGASASFYSTQDQNSGVANSIQALTLNSVDWTTDIILTNMTEITMINAGKYNIAFSAQLHQTNGSGVVNIWLNKNGTPLPNSNTRVDITANNPYAVAAWNLFVDAAAGDFYELMWSSDSPSTVIEHIAETGSGATLRPAVPSVIVTVNQVG